MALTKTKTMSGDSRYSIELKVTETATDLSTNSSTVSYTLKATKSSGSGYYTSNSNNPIKVTINGVNVVDKKVSYDFTGSTPKTITLASGTVTGIEHEPDGTKTIACSGYFKDANNSLGNATASGNLTLSQLHKAPVINDWTRTETNAKLLNIGLAEYYFVKGLSQIQFNITSATYYDDAHFSKMMVYDENTYSKITELSTNPATFTPTQAGIDTYLNLKLCDDKNGISDYSDTGWRYVVLDYTNLSLNASAKREGQTSGQVSINCSGDYFNGTIGNKNQGGTYKPTIKYKYWRLDGSEPSTYGNTVNTSSISISNGVYTVSALNIGSTTDTDPNYFNPQYAYKVKLQVSDNFTSVESNELIISVGEPTWTEYKDRVDFKKITVDGVDPIYYKKGDTYEADYIYTGGFLSNSTKGIYFTIFLPKSFKPNGTGDYAITQCTVNQCTFGIRKSNGGYLEQNTSKSTFATIEFRDFTDNRLTFICTKSSAYSSATNNTPIGVGLENLKVTFN